MTNKVLITGSSGTIGTALFKRLREQDDMEVKGLDIRRNIFDMDISSDTYLVNLLNQESLEEIDESFDQVVHLAAHPRVHESVQNPSIARDNFMMLYNILEWSRKRDVDRFIFSSSREVYGNGSSSFTSEEDIKLRRSESPYSATKLGGESLLHSYANCYDLDIVITRLSNVYGKYDFKDRVIPKWIYLAKNDEDLHLYGREKSLDFTFISDCIDALELLIRRSTYERTFNVSSGRTHSLYYLAEQIIDQTDSDSSIVIEDSKNGEVKTYRADLRRIRNYLGYKAQIGLDEGLKKTLRWYESNWKKFRRNIE